MNRIGGFEIPMHTNEESMVELRIKSNIKLKDNDYDVLINDITNNLVNKGKFTKENTINWLKLKYVSISDEIIQTVVRKVFDKLNL